MRLVTCINCRSWRIEGPFGRALTEEEQLAVDLLMTNKLLEFKSEFELCPTCKEETGGAYSRLFSKNLYKSTRRWK